MTLQKTYIELEKTWNMVICKHLISREYEGCMHCLDGNSLLNAHNIVYPILHVSS